MAYQQPYANGFVPPPLPGWGQPPFQQPGYGQLAPQQYIPATPQQNGPPLKKQKGNSFVTQYPSSSSSSGWKPPFQSAGYQPPATAYESHQYAAPAPVPYQQVQPPQPTHTPQAPYQPTTPYAQQPYQPGPNLHYPYDQRQGYQYDPNQAYQQPPYQPPQVHQQAQQYQSAQAYQPVQPYQSAQQPYQPAQAYPQAQAYPPAQAYPSVHAVQPQSGYYNGAGAWQVTQPSYTAPLPEPEATTHAGMPSMPGTTGEDGYGSMYQQSISEHQDDRNQDYSEGVSITDEIDSRFSLGLITWVPAVEKKRPLPATFNEAELEDLAPSKPPQDVNESISKYFVNSKKHEIELSIKQTDEWEEVKNDLIFVEFVATCEVVPLLAVIENRARTDASSEKIQSINALSAQAGPSVPQTQFAQPAIKTETVLPKIEEDSDGDQAMEMSDDEDYEPAEAALDASTRLAPQAETTSTPIVQPVAHHEPAPQHTNVLDSLEQALGSNEAPRLGKPPSALSSARQHRSRSPEKMNRSRQGSQQPRGRPSEVPRDAAQESVLAALGVEGSPKMVFPGPPPALGPPPSSDRNTSFFRPMPHNGMFHHPQGYGPNFIPPPPPREARSPSLDPWKAHDAIHGDPRRMRSPSASSQHTAAGSDFHADGLEDMDATPKAKPPPPPQERNGDLNGSGRKRPYERMVEEEDDKRRRQPDDTPKARRKPNYDRTDAYSRRW